MLQDNFLKKIPKLFGCRFGLLFWKKSDILCVSCVSKRVDHPWIHFGCRVDWLGSLGRTLGLRNSWKETIKHIKYVDCDYFNKNISKLITLCFWEWRFVVIQSVFFHWANDGSSTVGSFGFSLFSSSVTSVASCRI